jgi:predicted nuclease with TOPRIM domain
MAISGDNMNERLVRVEEKVDALSDKVDTLSDKFDGLTIQFEKVRDDIKKLGEGYEDGMRRLSTEIKNINRRWSEKWSPHDLAIKDHGKRITALEQRRK